MLSDNRLLASLTTVAGGGDLGTSEVSEGEVKGRASGAAVFLAPRRDQIGTSDVRGHLDFHHEVFHHFEFIGSPGLQEAFRRFQLTQALPTERAKMEQREDVLLRGDFVEPHDGVRYANGQTETCSHAGESLLGAPTIRLLLDPKPFYLVFGGIAAQRR